MPSKQALLRTLCLTLLVAMIPWAQSQASVIGKTVLHVQCSEGGEEALPKRIQMLQVVNDASFSSAPFLGVEVVASYPFRFDVDRGKVVVQGVLIKEDGSEIDLPKMTARMRLGDAVKVKSTDVEFDRGDIIEWKIRLKGLAPLMGLGDCFTVQVGIMCSETYPITSLRAIASELGSKKR